MALLLTGVMALFCGLAWYRSLLTFAGAASAFFLGLVIFNSIGWNGLAVIILFFITSVLLTKAGKYKKNHSTIIRSEKEGRTFGQVAANGGAAFIGACGYLLSKDSIWICFFISSISGAAADTWASELGVLSKKKPYHIRLKKRVESGLSGAVSGLGTIASLAGGFTVSAAGAWLFRNDIHGNAGAFSILFAAAGFLGSFTDTVIGAYFEKGYRCTVCLKETETQIHCGKNVSVYRGLPWMTNNAVNFLSSFLAGLIGLFGGWLL